MDWLWAAQQEHGLGSLPQQESQDTIDVGNAISIGRRFIMTHGDSYDILVSTNGNYPFSTLLYVVPRPHDGIVA